MPTSPSTPSLRKPLAAKNKDGMSTRISPNSAAARSLPAALLTPPRRNSPSRSYFLSPSSPARSLVEEDIVSVDLVTDVNENDIDEEVSFPSPTLIYHTHEL